MRCLAWSLVALGLAAAPMAGGIAAFGASAQGPCLSPETYPSLSTPNPQALRAAGGASDQAADRRGAPLEQGRAARAAYLSVEPSEPHANLSFVHSYVVGTIRQRKGFFRVEDWEVAVVDGTVQRGIDALDQHLGTPGCSGIVATILTSPGASDPGPYPPPASLRSVDWAEVVTHDPDLLASARPRSCHFGEIDVWVRYEADPAIEGAPWPNRTQYGDLDGDGIEEAVVPLLQSCTGGADRSLIYTTTSNGPSIATIGPGYGRAVETEIVDGVLEVTEAIYRPDEARCCPTGGTMITRYRLVGDQLVEVGPRVGPR